MKAKPAKKSVDKSQFDAVFRDLCAILQPFKDKLDALQNTPIAYDVYNAGIVFRGKPVMFAMVRMGKNYVSYHLMPVYMNDELQKRISPALRKRMQGMSCFNFSQSDPAAFAELGELTAAGMKRFSDPAFWRTMEEADGARKSRKRG